MSIEALKAALGPEADHLEQRIAYADDVAKYGKTAWTWWQWSINPAYDDWGPCHRAPTWGRGSWRRDPGHVHMDPPAPGRRPVRVRRVGQTEILITCATRSVADAMAERLGVDDE